MKLPAKCVAALLPLVLSGCVHKSNQVQVQPPLAPPIVDAPPVKTTPPTDLPPPVVTAPAGSQTTANTAPPAQTPPPKPKHHRPAPKPQEPAAPAQQPANTQVASNEAPAESAVGHLSTGDPSDLRAQTENSISATERGLRNITRKLSDTEQKTADQISEFLKEARKALASGDIDGAQTLAAKAKVLLSELTR